MAKRTKDERIQPDDPRLREILYCIGAHCGLRKLVPCHRGIGSPPFTNAGTLVRDDDPLLPRYLRVQLTAVYGYHGKEWSDMSQSWECCITITDGDDYILQYWLPFTYDNWCKQIDCYNSINQISPAVLDFLEFVGFK
jgi:hypothetical protein